MYCYNMVVPGSAPPRFDLFFERRNSSRARETVSCSPHRDRREGPVRIGSASLDVGFGSDLDSAPAFERFFSPSVGEQFRQVFDFLNLALQAAAIAQRGI